MRDRFLAVLLTLAVFAVGFGAGTWAERHRPFPGPPAALMEEFGAKRTPAPGTQEPPVNRAELLEQIAKIRPEIDSFRERTNEIYAQFDRDMLTVLTPEQEATYVKKFRSQRVLQPQDEDKPISDDEIQRLLQRPFRTLAFFVVVPMTLDRMATELKLDDAQRDKVRDLLRVRREKFIELVDSVPPPSLMLSRLAPVAQRLSQPVKP
jgi:Spy/CpxP family protein refolding chaperone